MIRIFIADDHAMVRGGLKQIIGTCSDMQVVGEATDGNALLSSLQRGACDLLLLDMTMPGLSGIDLIQRLQKEHPALPVLIARLGGNTGAQFRAQAGALSGYVLDSLRGLEGAADLQEDRLHT